MTDPDARRFQRPCAAEEEIAALIDGMVAAAERRRLVAHLAGCESCYAVFAGAAHERCRRGWQERRRVVTSFCRLQRER